MEDFRKEPDEKNLEVLFTLCFSRAALINSPFTTWKKKEILEIHISILASTISFWIRHLFESRFYMNSMPMVMSEVTATLATFIEPCEPPWVKDPEWFSQTEDLYEKTDNNQVLPEEQSVEKQKDLDNKSVCSLSETEDLSEKTDNNQVLPKEQFAEKLKDLDTEALCSLSLSAFDKNFKILTPCTTPSGSTTPMDSPLWGGNTEQETLQHIQHNIEKIGIKDHMGLEPGVARGTQTRRMKVSMHLMHP